MKDYERLISRDESDENTKQDEQSDLMQLLNAIREARNNLEDAKRIRCTCSSFVIQYEGCGCERFKKVLQCENKFWLLINSI